MIVLETGIKIGSWNRKKETSGEILSVELMKFSPWFHMGHRGGEGILNNI